MTLFWRKVATHCQFPWMHCFHFWCKKVNPHIVWPFSPWHLKGIFLLHLSSRNYGDACNSSHVVVEACISPLLKIIIIMWKSSSEQQKVVACLQLPCTAWGWCFPATQTHRWTWQNKPDNELLREHPSPNTSWQIMIRGKRTPCICFATFQFISCLLECCFGSSHALLLYNFEITCGLIQCDKSRCILTSRILNTSNWIKTVQMTFGHWWKWTHLLEYKFEVVAFMVTVTLQIEIFYQQSIWSATFFNKMSLKYFKTRSPLTSYKINIVLSYLYLNTTLWLRTFTLVILMLLNIYQVLFVDKIYNSGLVLCNKIFCDIFFYCKLFIVSWSKGFYEFYDFLWILCNFLVFTVWIFSVRLKIVIFNKGMCNILLYWILAWNFVDPTTCPLYSVGPDNKVHLIFRLIRSLLKINGNSNLMLATTWSHQIQCTVPKRMMNLQEVLLLQEEWRRCQLSMICTHPHSV